MDDKIGAFKAILYALSEAATFLFTKPLGLAILGAALLLAAGARLWTAVSDRRLAAKAAGEYFGRSAAIGAALRELTGLGVRAAGALPALAGIAAALVLLVGVANATRAVDDYISDRKRVAELTTTVRNLERRYKAVEARIDDAKDGRIKANLAFFDYKNPSAPAKTQSIDIAGKELFIDAIVCNFDYSEISAGRAVNLAIPFRVFSDEVSESEGVSLSLLDEKGLPLMYHRSADELYGIGLEAYEARLAELMASLRTDETARGSGIVRSLYGDAVHRGVKKGDSFSVWVEQSGGLSVKDAVAF
ncbi:MAG: hypothetical protein ABSF43_01040 [Rectinemataceae bacterium]|jgi:hypothetical protein